MTQLHFHQSLQHALLNESRVLSPKHSGQPSQVPAPGIYSEWPEEQMDLQPEDKQNIQLLNLNLGQAILTALPLFTRDDD